MCLVDDSLIVVAEQFLEQDLCLNRGEKLLIYVDSDVTKVTVEAMQKAASRKGISCGVAQLPAGVEQREKEQALEALVERETFDVLCEASEDYFYPSFAWQRALRKGAGIYAIGALDTDAFMRCFGSVSRSVMHDFGNKISQMLNGARKIEITSQQGTRITMEMKMGVLQRSWLKLTRRMTQSMVSVPSGDLQRGRYTFSPGQICFLGVPASIKGIAIIDGYIWPPPELGVLTESVVIHIKGGEVIEISGSRHESNLLRAWLKGRANDLKHFGLGFSPRAQMTGTLGEAERVFGAVTLGMGEYPFHTDAIMTQPTIIIDGRIIEKDGIFVEKDLANMKKRLG